MSRSRRRLMASVLATAVLAALAAWRWPGATAPAMRDHGPRRDAFALGAAVQLSALTLDPRYGDTVARHFDALTPENEMKWNAIHPAPGLYQFGPADTIVAFAQDHGMKVRGHTLTWYRQNPSWLTDTPRTRDEWIAVLRDHITTVVSRYRGQIFQWDVVNEAVAGDGTLRDNVWLRGIGPDYIPLAFHFAHQADPGARLYYNDFDAEQPGPKTDAVLGLVTALRQGGVPVHGVGLQLHTTLSPPRPAAIAATMKRLERMGLEVAVTEIDVRLRLPPSAPALKRQAVVYRSVLRTCLAAPNCTAFVSWGFTDRYSWIPSSYPGYGAALPFDPEYRPKPAVDALISALRD